MQCCYSPDEAYVVTGTSAEAKDRNGSLVVLDGASLEKRAEVAVNGSAVAVQVGLVCKMLVLVLLQNGTWCQMLPAHLSLQWHPSINQIFLGCGGRTSGCVRTLYDPKLSTKGAVVAASRAPRTTTTEFMQVSAQPDNNTLDATFVPAWVSGLT
jgi:hypothetical protein